MNTPFLSLKIIAQQFPRSIDSLGSIFLCFSLLACNSVVPIPSNSSSSSGGNTINIPSGSVGIPGGVSMPSGSSTTSSGESATGGPANNGKAPSLEELDSDLENSLDDFDSRLGGAADGSSMDVLDPMGGRTLASDSNRPMYEELEDIGNPIAERADQGAVEAESLEDVESIPSRNKDSRRATNIPIPDDIGEGQGDDIVERQIREAASRETDPILREKLWEEYRRAKGRK